MLSPGRKRSDAVSGGQSETGLGWKLLGFESLPEVSYERDLDCEDCYGFGSACELPARGSKGEVGVFGWAVLQLPGACIVRIIQGTGLSRTHVGS
jgi:hypothetical protein